MFFKISIFLSIFYKFDMHWLASYHIYDTEFIHFNTSVTFLLLVPCSQTQMHVSSTIGLGLGTR